MTEKNSTPPSEKTSLILIVEDYLQNLQILGKNLENAGYDIAIANNGEDGVKAAQEVNPDLILLDVMMPGMSGYAACEILKKDPKTAGIPVIFLTARTDPDDILEGYQKGAVDYVYKPFNAPELLMRVKTHLDLKEAREKLDYMSPLLKELSNEVAGMGKQELWEKFEKVQGILG